MKTNIISLIYTVFTVSQLASQTLNTEIVKEGSDPFLLGKIDKSGLQGDNYKTWFVTNYNAYQPNTSITTSISEELTKYHIKLFMGTWCGDSKQEVSKLYKVLEACNFPVSQLTVVAVSRESHMYKQSPQHEEAGLNIHRVPTILFYKNGKEINRIIEHPVESFEEDIQNIITVNTYQANYEIVSKIDAILEKKGIKGLKKKSKTLVRNFKNKVTSMFELNTYGRILYGTEREEEAIAVFRLNTQLFPDEPKTYMSLANTLDISGYKDSALKVLKDAIKLHPDNSHLKENLEVIKSN